MLPRPPALVPACPRCQLWRHPFASPVRRLGWATPSDCHGPPLPPLLPHPPEQGIVRTARAAAKHSWRSRVYNFWSTPDWGLLYSTGTAIYLTLTCLFFVKALMALKRLANAEYYIHPQRNERGRAERAQSHRRGMWAR